MTSSSSRKVRCPQCGGDSLYSPANPWRPFCSERCKQIDLGCWANDGYRIVAQADEEAGVPALDFTDQPAR